MSHTLEDMQELFMCAFCVRVCACVRVCMWFYIMTFLFDLSYLFTAVYFTSMPLSLFIN